MTHPYLEDKNITVDGFFLFQNFGFACLGVNTGNLETVRIIFPFVHSFVLLLCDGNNAPIMSELCMPFVVCPFTYTIQQSITTTITNTTTIITCTSISNTTTTTNTSTTTTLHATIES